MYNSYSDLGYKNIYTSCEGKPRTGYRQQLGYIISEEPIK